MRRSYQGKSRKASSGSFTVSHCQVKNMKKKAQGEKYTARETHSAEVVRHDDVHQITGPSSQLQRRRDRSA